MLRSLGTTPTALGRAIPVSLSKVHIPHFRPVEISSDKRLARWIQQVKLLFEAILRPKTLSATLADPQRRKSIGQDRTGL